MTTPAAKLRLDKWLWQARFCKTRTLASSMVSAGHVRVNGHKAGKPAHQVGPSDVLTFPQGNRIRVVRILALGDRRGPATEAQGLYEDLTPETPKPEAPAPKFDRGGRPTKKDRRSLDRARDQTLD